MADSPRSPGSGERLALGVELAELVRDQFITSFQTRINLPTPEQWRDAYDARSKRMLEIVGVLLDG